MLRLRATIARARPRYDAQTQASCLWLVFAFVLFIGEPIILHRHFYGWAIRHPDIAFAWLHRAH